MRDVVPDPSALTYDAVGETARPDLLTSPPTGFRPDERWAVVGRGEEDFRRVADDLLHWGMQRGSGIRVTCRGADGAPYDPAGRRIAVGDSAVLRIGRWPIAVPILVLSVVDEDTRAAFTYGTLPGHPECGEELFEASRDPDGSVRVLLRSFSRPGRLLARIGRPVLRFEQERFTRRYLRALPLPR